MSVSVEHDFEATELRLGLPGSDSAEKKGLVNLISAGSKRGFSDALHGGSGKWVLSDTSGSEANLSKVRANGGSDAKIQQVALAVKDGVPQSPKPMLDKKPHFSATAAKAQVVGWPPIRSFRKNTMANHPQKNDNDDVESKSGSGCLYVKVSMDGAPYLRKVDLKTYGSYADLSSGLEKMFRCFTIGQCSSHGLSESRLMDLLHGSEYVLTYEDKDGDWMLVGDVPWGMFKESCKRMRIMKSSDAIGLAPRAMEKCKSRS